MEHKKTPTDSANSAAPPVDSTPSTFLPLVVPAAGAARLCAMSRAQWFKLVSSGRTPAPVRLSARKPVWLVSELREWLEAGAPPRDVWERLKQRGGKR